MSPPRVSRATTSAKRKSTGAPAAAFVAAVDRVTPADTEEDKEQFIMKRLMDNFKVFLFIIWKHLGLPPPTPLQYEIADYLQYGGRRSIIEAFRGFGKSWITSAYVLWCLLRDPQERFLIVSASQQRAIDFSTFTLRLIHEVPFLQHLRPREDQRSSKLAFDVGPATAAHSPSVKSIGVFGAMAGSRATHVIGDDTEIPNNSATQDLREKLLKAVGEFESIVMPEVGRITFLGTPQTEETIYSKLHKERGYDLRVWPARYPSLHEAETKYANVLAPSLMEKLMANPGLAGRPTDTRFSDTELLERELALGRSAFALQFMLDTALSDADRYPLKLADLIVMNIHPTKAPITLGYASGPDQRIKTLPEIGLSGDHFYGPMWVDKEWTEFTNSVMAIDPSGRGKDLTSYAVVKYLNGWLYLVDCGGFTGGYDDNTLNSLAKLAKEHQVKTVLVEGNYGDGMFQKLFQPILARQGHFALEEVKNWTQKELRIIDTLEPVLNRHRLVVDLEWIRKDYKATYQEGGLGQAHSLLYQLTRITKDRGALKHDDKLDALHMAVKFFVDMMARDDEKGSLAYENRKLQEEMRSFQRLLQKGQVVKPKELLRPPGATSSAAWITT